jgi:predicted small lipoprotein YifL
MRRYLYFLMVAVLLVPLVLTACGAEVTTPPEEPTKEVVAPTAVVEQPTATALPAQDLLAEVKLANKLLVSTDPNYAPQSFLNDKGRKATRR